MTDRSTTLERWAPLAAGVLFAIPVLVARYPPMTDLALHEAVLGVLRHYGDPKYFPPGLYHLNLGHPNQLFFFAAWPMSYVVGTTWALKLVVAATEVGLFLGAARFARYLGTPQWTALLVGTLGLGWLFYWGLLANLIGLAIMLAVLPLLDRFVIAPTVRGALWSFAALVLLHFAHETSMLCAVFMMGLFALGHPLLSRLFLLRMAPPVAGFGVAVLEIWWDQFLRPPFNKAIPTMWDPFVTKLGTMPGVLFAGYEAYVRNLMFAIAILAIVLFAVERWRQRPRIWGTPLRELFQRFRFEIFAVLLMGLYFALPFTLDGATLFYHRYYPPAYAVIAIVLAPQAATATWRLPRFAAAAVPIASLAIAWPSFVDSNQMVRDLDALVDMTDYDAAVVMVDVGRTPLRMFSSATLEGHIVALRGGRSLFDFTRSPISPGYQNPEYAWDEPWVRLQKQTYLIRPEHDLDRFRYLYFHCVNQAMHPIAAVALAGDAKFIASKGEWALFESTHLKYDVLSKESGGLPYPRPHTLRKRAKDVIRHIEGEPIPPEIVQDPPPGWQGPALALPAEKDDEKNDDKADPPAGSPSAKQP